MDFSHNLEMLFLIPIICDILLLNTILVYNTQILFHISNAKLMWHQKI